MQVPSPPTTRREDVTDAIHGVEIADPYRWLEDGNSSETRAWIAAQQKYTAPFLRTPEHEQFHRRISELLKVDAFGLPIERNGYYFFMRRRADQQRGVIVRRRGLNGPDEVLIDPHSMSAENMIGVEIRGLTPDGSFLAYAIRHGGADEEEIRVMDVASRRDLPDVLPRARYYATLSWKHDNSGFYYMTLLKEGPRIRFHRIGTAISDDAEIFGGLLAPNKFAIPHVTDDGRYLIIHVVHGSAADRTEVYVQRLDIPAEMVPLVNDIDAYFVASDAGDSLIVTTNWNAPNRRVLRVDLSNPSRDTWREIVPETSSRIESVATIGGKVIVTYLEDVRSRVRVFEPDGAWVRDVDLPGVVTAGWFLGRWQRSESFFFFTSFNQAPTIWRYDLATGARDVWWRYEAAPDPEQFELRQIWYDSKDGTRVPMYLFHRRDLTLDGARPLLLTGYGGFNVSMVPYFSPEATAWAEAGGVYAVANLRGGGEFGDRWHRAGQRENKQNVFDDFIAAAQWLIANSYTRPSKLAISGASNGGLLVGAALTQRPELFRAVVCHRPVLDMIANEKHPLAQLWIQEYGSVKEPDQFRYMIAYSPYHNVRPETHYPAVMFVTGDLDTRVDAMQARKMCAALQWANAPRENPILLHYRAEAGHMPGLPLDATIDEGADILTFLAGELGFEPGCRSLGAP